MRGWLRLTVVMAMGLWACVVPVDAPESALAESAAEVSEGPDLARRNVHWTEGPESVWIGRWYLYGTSQKGGPDLVEYRGHDTEPGAHVPCLVVPHEDERSAFAVAMRVLHERPVRVIRIEQAGERNIRLGHSLFDPNRITTAKGARASAERLNRGRVEERDVQAAQALGRSLLRHLDSCQRPIIALHNNTARPSRGDGRNFSVRTYAEGGAEAASAAQMEGNPRIFEDEDPDDFVLITRPELEPLVPGWTNLVVQAAEPVPDGSLSAVLAEDSYLNIEAQHGHHGWQYGVVTWVLDGMQGELRTPAP